MNKKDMAYFNMAKAVSQTSNFPKFHIGCVVVYGNRVISSAANYHKTHPLQRVLNKERFDDDAANHFGHAELFALLPIMNRKDINWNKVQLYIYREHKNGTKALASPCPGCRKLIKNLNIKKISYTTENGYIQEFFD